MASMNNRSRRRDGVARRDFLRVGAATALALSSQRVVRRANASESIAEPRAKACILVWLDGGASHLETFDLKREAPSEVRGPFRPISTSTPGVHICEHMPRLAERQHKLAIVRSMTSPLGEHNLGAHYVLTGYKPSQALVYPSFGSVTAELRGASGGLPSYVAVPGHNPMAGEGYLGAAARPFDVGGDPAKPDFQVRDLKPYLDVTMDRVDRRREFVTRLDHWQAAHEARAAGGDPRVEQAFDLLTSPSAKGAFDLSAEPREVRARYGARTIGQSCLLARRLVEAGVPFVTVHNTGWDTHQDMVLRLQEGFSGAKEGVGLIPLLDQAVAALVDDLDERGLLDETLVLVTGEFGRTPKINTDGGRDHWPRVFSCMLAGGGTRRGVVVGASDKVGESPADRPVTPSDLAATIYALLGIDTAHMLQTSDGRPVPVNQGGVVVPELLA